MPKSDQPVQITQEAMGTVMTHRAFGPRAAEALQQVRAEVDRLEGLLSRFRPESDISRLNAAAGQGRVTVHPETVDVLTRAAELSRLSAGSFDITIAPLVALWQAARKSQRPPDESDIRRVLPLVTWRDLELDPESLCAGLRRVGQAVDLGGIGKGYAGDRLVDLLRGCGIGSAFSNLGGNVVTVGARPDGSPWQVGIQHPRREGELIGAVGVVNESVVTSGDYQRYYTDSGGRRWHHILSPVTGYPAESGWISVTIVARCSLVADALSTAVFVAGKEKGLDLLGRQDGIGAILVEADQRICLTLGLQARFRAAEGVQVATVELRKGC